jgi:anti-sigma factor RsiW
MNRNSYSSNSQKPRRTGSTPSFASARAYIRKQVILRRMSAYVRGEQSAEAKRETARWIDSDDAVYSAYRQEKQADNALRADIAPLGRPERVQLDRAFANIGAALNGRTPLYRLPMRHLSGWKASAAAVVMAALMLVPLAASHNRAAATGVPTQPEPRATVGEEMTATGDGAAIVASRPDKTLTPALATAQLNLRATPTAPEKE